MKNVSLINGHIDGVENGTTKLISDLRKLGKYSSYEPNYLLLAADHLEKLQVENEDLKFENLMLSQKRVNLFERLQIVQSTELKAYKDFATKLEKKLGYWDDGQFAFWFVTDADIDNLLNELINERDGGNESK